MHRTRQAIDDGDIKVVKGRPRPTARTASPRRCPAPSSRTSSPPTHGRRHHVPDIASCVNVLGASFKHPRAFPSRTLPSSAAEASGSAPHVHWQPGYKGAQRRACSGRPGTRALSAPQPGHKGAQVRSELPFASVPVPFAGAAVPPARESCCRRAAQLSRGVVPQPATCSLEARQGGRCRSQQDHTAVHEGLVNEVAAVYLDSSRGSAGAGAGSWRWRWRWRWRRAQCTCGAEPGAPIAELGSGSSTEMPEAALP